MARNLIDPSPRQRKILLKRLRNNDQKAFEVIYNLYFEIARFYAGKFVSFELAEEAAQHTLTELWQNRQKFEQWNHLRGFIYRTTRNCCINLLKKENKEIKKLKEYASYDVDAMYVYDEVLHLELNDELKYILQAQLSGKQQKLFGLLMNGHDIAEAAKKLNITKATALNYKSLALSALRQKIPAIKKSMLKAAMQILMLL